MIPEIATLATHEIDHIIAEKHGGCTEAENLALSCTLCNKHKGSDIASVDPETGEIVPLYNPRQKKWNEHLWLSLFILLRAERHHLNMLKIIRTQFIPNLIILVFLS